MAHVLLVRDRGRSLALLGAGNLIERQRSIGFLADLQVWQAEWFSKV